MINILQVWLNNDAFDIARLKMLSQRVINQNIGESPRVISVKRSKVHKIKRNIHNRNGLKYKIRID